MLAKLVVCDADDFAKLKRCWRLHAYLLVGRSRNQFKLRAKAKPRRKFEV
jgi:hypothetical protein